MLVKAYYSMRQGAQSRLRQLAPQMSSWYDYFRHVFLDMYHLLHQVKLWEYAFGLRHISSISILNFFVFVFCNSYQL
jgi:hypothetical protein